MDKTKHTPGPWDVSEAGEGLSKIWWIDAKEKQITPNCGYDDSQDIANARLIAAAPDLLRVAEGCLGYLASLPMSYRPDDRWFMPLTDAIAKATRE